MNCSNDGLGKVAPVMQQWPFDLEGNQQQSNWTYDLLKLWESMHNNINLVKTGVALFSPLIKDVSICSRRLSRRLVSWSRCREYVTVSFLTSNDTFTAQYSYTRSRKHHWRGDGKVVKVGGTGDLQQDTVFLLMSGKLHTWNQNNQFAMDK